MVRDSLDKRQERLSSVTNNLVSAMGAIGINLTETFQEVIIKASGVRVR